MQPTAGLRLGITGLRLLRMKVRDLTTPDPFLIAPTVTTQGFQSSSFWVMTYFLLRDYNIPPK